MTAPRITYALDRDDPRRDHALRFILERAGYGAHRVHDPAAPVDLHDGDPPAGRPHRLVSPRADDGLLFPDILHGKPVGCGRTRFPCDVVGAIADFLSDRVPHERGLESRDFHGRLKFESSYLTRRGCGDLPVVDLYARRFAAWIGESLGIEGIPLWPAGKRAAIALTHDVDTPDRYALLSAPLWPRHRTWRSNLGLLLDRYRLFRERAARPDPDDFWLFDDIARVESARGFRSSFYFAVTPFFDPLGSPYDVHYDARAPRYLDVMRRLADAGFEIGLHASYDAHRAPVERLAGERAKLRALTGGEVAGVRHHYWMLGEDPDAVFAAHERAGFAYDSSLGFNDHAGFRRGAATPFRPFVAAGAREIGTLQIPVFCMDGNLFYQPGPYDARLREVRDLVDRIKDAGGGAALLWHDRTSFPRNREYRDWGRAYIDILDGLARDRDLWVTSPIEIARWLERRRARLS